MPVTLFPFELPEDVKASNMFLGPFRLGAPTLFGGTGVELRSQNRVRIVAFEWPAEYAPVSDKAAKERQHLNRFNVDYRAGTGHAAYASIEQNLNDPPDFRCFAADSERGVECTQLVVQDRLEAEASFRRLRSGLLRESQLRVRHLEGHVVYVALDPAASKRVPDAVTALMSGLEEHDPTIGAARERRVQSGRALRGDARLRRRDQDLGRLQRLHESGCPDGARAIAGDSPAHGR